MDTAIHKITDIKYRLLLSVDLYSAHGLEFIGAIKIEKRGGFRPDLHFWAPWLEVLYKHDLFSACLENSVPFIINGDSAIIAKPWFE
jgi:hypothetical protein